MPYEIKQSSDCPASKPFALVNVATGEIVACHESQESAQSQMDAILAEEEQGRQVHDASVSFALRVGEFRRDDVGEGRRRGRDSGT